MLASSATYPPRYYPSVQYYPTCAPSWRGRLEFERRSMTTIALAVALASSTLGLHGTWLRTGRRAVRAQPIVCRDDEPIVVIGSGIGGLSCACLLARYGRRVTVVESHEHAGGCAHSFERRTKEGTFVFDSGPSLWSGMSTPSVNPRWPPEVLVAHLLRDPRDVLG